MKRFRVNFDRVEVVPCVEQLEAENTLAALSQISEKYSGKNNPTGKPCKVINVKVYEVGI